MSPDTGLPTEINATAFVLKSEYAWQRKDLKTVFDYFTRASIAVLAGEAWIVMQARDCKINEPIEQIRHLIPNSRYHTSILGLTSTHIVYGIFPLKSGESAVFSWVNAPRGRLQSWQDYVRATIKETADFIRAKDLESGVSPEYAGYIYYNLKFASKETNSNRWQDVMTRVIGGVRPLPSVTRNTIRFTGKKIRPNK